jgi:hypothetical protein
MVNVIFSVSFRSTFTSPALKYNFKIIISSSANISTVNGKMKFSILFDAGNHPTVYQSATLCDSTTISQKAICYMALGQKVYGYNARDLAGF